MIADTFRKMLAFSLAKPRCFLSRVSEIPNGYTNATLCGGGFFYEIVIILSKTRYPK